MATPDSEDWDAYYRAAERRRVGEQDPFLWYRERRRCLERAALIAATLIMSTVVTAFLLVFQAEVGPDRGGVVDPYGPGLADVIAGFLGR